MLPRPKHTPRTHLKHPSSNSRQGASERVWLKRFWLVFGLLGLTAIALLGYQYYASQPEVTEVYLPVTTRTAAGSHRMITSRLSLVIDPAQEKALRQRQPELEHVVNATFAELYQNDQRPPLGSVRDRLLEALNTRLPERLQVQDVLIQDLLVGTDY